MANGEAMEVMVGRIDERTKTLLTNQSSIFDRLNNLPCSSHVELMKDNRSKIKQLVEWKDSFEKLSTSKKIEIFKSRLTLGNAILVVVLTNLFTLLVTILTRSQ